METTTNYKLPQWVKADPIKMQDFNAAFASIDAALKAEGDARSEADGTAAERITALAQTIANGKICRIKYGSYAGNGLSGAENPNKIDCGFYPLLVMVSEQSDTQHWALRGVSGFYNSNNRGNAAKAGSASRKRISISPRLPSSSMRRAKHIIMWCSAATRTEARKNKKQPPAQKSRGLKLYSEIFCAYVND